MRRTAVLPADAPDVPLESVKDVVALLGQTINQTRKGTLDAKVCNAVVQGATVLLRALEGADTQRQIDELRRRLEEAETRGHGSAKAGAGPHEGAVRPADGCGASGRSA
jgi:hypothetical protein